MISGTQGFMFSMGWAFLGFEGNGLAILCSVVDSGPLGLVATIFPIMYLPTRKLVCLVTNLLLPLPASSQFSCLSAVMPSESGHKEQAESFFYSPHRTLKNTISTSRMCNFPPAPVVRRGLCDVVVEL